MLVKEARYSEDTTGCLVLADHSVHEARLQPLAADGCLQMEQPQQQV